MLKMIIYSDGTKRKAKIREKTPVSVRMQVFFISCYWTEYSFGDPWASKIFQFPTSSLRRIAFLCSAQRIGSVSTDVIRIGAYWLYSV
jgi:hypothetical protein